jgi:hypothetical protein
MSDIGLFDQGLTDSTRAKFNRILTQLDIALAALKAVEKREHQNGYTDCDKTYVAKTLIHQGRREGHRCAAAICRKAREEIEKV